MNVWKIGLDNIKTRMMQRITLSGNIFGNAKSSERFKNFLEYS